jgi:hypothetical protein
MRLKPRLTLACLAFVFSITVQPIYVPTFLSVFSAFISVLFLCSLVFLRQRRRQFRFQFAGNLLPDCR